MNRQKSKDCIHHTNAVLANHFCRSFTLAVREALIELFQHFQRLLSVLISGSGVRFRLFTLAVREAFVKLLQHFLHLLSVSSTYPRDCPVPQDDCMIAQKDENRKYLYKDSYNTEIVWIFASDF